MEDEKTTIEKKLKSLLENLETEKFLLKNAHNIERKEDEDIISELQVILVMLNILLAIKECVADMFFDPGLPEG